MNGPLRYRLAWAVSAALAAYLVFFGGAWLGLYLTDLRIVQAIGWYRAAHELRVDLSPATVYPILEGGASIAGGRTRIAE